MQSVSSRIWTCIAVSISYDDSHYTIGTPTLRLTEACALTGNANDIIEYGSTFACTIAIYMNMRNVHWMFMYIYIEHRNLETRKTLDDFFVQVRNYLLPLSLKVLRHKEREAQSFYYGFFIYTPPRTCVAPATKVSASKWKPTVFPRGSSHLNSLTFSKSPKILRDVTRTP